MSTTTTTSRAPAPWSAFGKFALVFGITFFVTYVVCLFKGWPLFSFHPATNRLAWGYELARRGEGPVMYWYGWVVTCLIVGTIAGVLGTFLPDSVVRRIPPALTWILLILAFPLMVYSLMGMLTK
jgi:hypothetical protein